MCVCVWRVWDVYFGYSAATDIDYSARKPDHTWSPELGPVLETWTYTPTQGPLAV